MIENNSEHKSSLIRTFKKQPLQKKKSILKECLFKHRARQA